MTFQEFTHLSLTGKRELEFHALLLQSIAIISGQSGFADKSPDEIFDIVVKQAADISSTELVGAL